MKVIQHESYIHLQNLNLPRFCKLIIKIALLFCLTTRFAIAMEVQVKEEDIQDFLPWLAVETGHNLVLDPTIEASLNFSLADINWEELLTLIAQQHQLNLLWQEDVAILTPITKALKSGALNCPVSYWRIENAKAEQVSEQLQVLFADTTFSYDGRTNAIFARLCHSDKAITTTIERLDTPLAQIEIGARIAQVQNANDEQIGINWSGRLGEQNTSNVTTNIALDIASQQSGFQFSIVDNVDALNLKLGFLATQGLANIVAEPKIVTEEGQTARIESGTEIPYQTTEEDTTRVEFKRAGLVLEVTPQIKVGGRIQLQLQIFQDAVGQIFNGIPSIDTNRITTRVTLTDQSTLILGGIYRDEVFSNKNVVPFFGELPLIGALFRKETERQEKMELLVFITPKLLQLSN
ncbi:type II and III secretion system protein [Marinomonas agarivorans]|nr:type II and III secretion system protein [Marinomonas agarivorans]